MKTKCPVCNRFMEVNPRYPNALCQNCVDLAVDEKGRPLVFYNEDATGGFQAVVKGTKELRDSHICYVQSIRCWADEAYMGGIVLTPCDENEQ